ncbi:hypothetical protein BCR34DRAFT_636538 [Clohesyomyces aquaticus]|uniref:Uncharacterized protein n=1 Tax=Clohesyomyces aquaticus TaxID=1231657 RepID=A0A1Y1YVQ7_9PLEO|nr:hypothetical protein BCR34DRAFT_636538 [Clohesyomyces aquaticus]
MAAQWPQEFDLTNPSPRARYTRQHLPSRHTSLYRAHQQPARTADHLSRHGDIHPESIARPRSQHHTQSATATNTGEEASAAAREATDVGKAVMGITRENKTKGLLNQVNTPVCYAAMAARSHTLAGVHDTQSLKGLSVQTQREVIVNIMDAHTEPKSNEPT